MNVENNGHTLVTMIQLGKIFIFHLVQRTATGSQERDIVDIE